MVQLKELLLVGSLTFAVGGVASLAGGANGVLVGGTTAAVLGVSLVTQRQNNKIARLETEINKQQDWEKINAKLPSFKVELQRRQEELERLEKEKKELSPIQGQLTENKTQLQQVENRLIELTQQKQELENRVKVINQQSPDLSQLEQLQKQIEQFRLDKSGLEGQLNSLGSQVENLAATKNNLQVIEAEFITRQAEFNTLNTKVEELRNQSQELEKKAAELELLRATYDGLFKEREGFEIRVNQLRPEIETLEAEKQRILQAIQENSLEYNRIEEYRQKLADLELQIRDKSALVRTIERNIDRLNGQKAALEENVSQLEQRLKELKGEIEEIENSANIALKSLKEKLWHQLPQTQLNFSNETEFLDGFIQYLQSEGLNFSQRVIKAFHTSLKVQDISALVILAGISGTGKSQLPQRYAEYMGAQLLTLPVQPRWDSPQDLQGFYNYVEKKYKPTDLMRGLYQYGKDPNMAGRIVIVLLDEMNLARVEYYFSDFLSKLETRRHKETYLDIDLGSLALPQSEKQLKIPNEFLFVGTMNEDETTQSLSDKVLDRANVLTFGKPENLQLLQEHQQTSRSGKHSDYLPYSDFESWIKPPNPNSDVVEKVKDILNQTNNVMEQIGHPFAHRVYQAITQYVVNYSGVEDSNSEVFKFAIADQFGQKLLPKLRGVMVDEMQNELATLKGIIQEIGDDSLIVAFEKARKGRYGQFHWQGLVYQQEQG